VWNYGHVFFYEGNLSTDEFLFLGRAMIALVSAATGLLIFFWSRALFGWRGAFLSLGLFVFSPTFLAHGALATSDVVMTFFFLAAVGAFWRHLEKPGTAGAALSALTLGVAFVAKFSAVVLPLMFAAIALVWFVSRRRSQGWRAPFVRLVRITLVHGIVAWLTIWAFYGFRFSAFAPGLADSASFNHGWNWLLSGMGWSAKIIWGLKEHHVLPEAWLYGLTFVIQFSKARGAFLNGDYSVTGWVSFFPFAFVAKTTIPFLIILGTTFGLAIQAFLGRLRSSGTELALSWLKPLTPLVVLFFVFWAVSLISHLNIGHRHLLPIYPVLFIAAGWLGRSFNPSRPCFGLFVSAVVAWHAMESLRIRPHYLAYFNQLVGGPINGWRHLVDSSLDWGQDLPTLAEWLRRNRARPDEAVFLAYFGTGEPGYEGIDATRLFRLPDFGKLHSWRALTKGTYCVSATLLQQVYAAEHRWTLPLERQYQELRVLEATFVEYSSNPLRRAELNRDTPPEKWANLWKRYELLRFMRLCSYLQVRPADANAGYSILIYRLSANQVYAATAGSLADWQRLIDQTANER
jgi:4-amino-4-deoxy-L-arabinose transferase-like glycosyltransferase